jgi:hypothetical protein
MAIATVNNPVRLVDTGLYTMWGYRAPANIARLEVADDIYGDKVVRWVAKGDPTIHRMTLSVVTDETIIAVLTAMRLSC